VTPRGRRAGCALASMCPGACGDCVRWGASLKARRALCLETETIPQVAVLHSEYHARATVTGQNLFWNVDTAAVEGRGLQLAGEPLRGGRADEWALLPRLREFPVVVAPEQHAISAEMVRALQAYVASGGKLLLTGAGALERFGEDFLGVTVAHWWSGARITCRRATEPRRCIAPLGACWKPPALARCFPWAPPPCWMNTCCLIPARRCIGRARGRCSICPLTFSATLPPIGIR